MLVVGLAAEELPHEVLAPPAHQVFVAEVERVLEVQQAHHQADRQSRAPGGAGAGTDRALSRTEQVAGLDLLPRALPALELRRQRRLDGHPIQTRRQHGQRVVQVDHRVNAGAEKVVRLHARIPQKSTPHTTLFGGIGGPGLHEQLRIHAACRRIAGPTR
jgi:hypothetical protein